MANDTGGQAAAPPVFVLEHVEEVNCSMSRLIPALLAALLMAAPAVAASPAAGLLKLLQSGRVPESRLPAFVEMICKRGDASDLTFIYSKAVAPDGYAGEARLQAFRALADAGLTRNVRPEGDLGALGRFIIGGDVDSATRLAAIELAGVWKDVSLLPPLKELALAEKTAPAARRAAIDALASIGGDAGRGALEELASAGHPYAVRARAIAGLAQSDAAAAAKKAAAMLAQSSEGDDPGALLEGFLRLQNGPEKLGAAIATTPPPKDIAKLALRSLYAVGRTDAPLVQPLGDAAGMTADADPPTREEAIQIAAEAAAHGDPARGEEVFRREDLSCMKCHSVSKAGGEIGPDLSAVGAKSPGEYLVRSVLNPSQNIKEAYLTTIILTLSGKQYQGIVTDRDERRVILKDANGETFTVPTADIDEEFEGESLMPSGLGNFMTRGELLDLVAFLSALGRPGEYAIRSTETMQRWRSLKNVPQSLAQSVPNDEVIQSEVLGLQDENAWQPAYAKVAGVLPLKELVKPAGSRVLYLKGDIDVTAAGDVGVQFNSLAGAKVWIDGHSVPAEPRFIVQLDRGRHTLLTRIDTTERGEEDLRVELFRPDDTTAQFEAVGGK
jgi:putative heme-binding domain-containing protein